MLWVLALSLFLLGFLNLTAYADESSTCNEWNPFSVGPITTWTAPVCSKGQFVIQPFFFYNRTMGSFDSDGHYDSLPTGDKKYQYQEMLFLQFGVTDKFEIDGLTVYQQNYCKQGGREAHSKGFGDSYFFLRHCLLEDKQWIPHLTAQFQVKAPTGKYQHADPDKLGTDLMGATSGGGSWDYGLGLNLSKKIKPFWLHADAIYSFPQKVRVDGASTRYANYLNYDFGVEYFLPRGFNFLFEGNGLAQCNRRENGKRIHDSDVRSFIICPGIGWSCEKIQTLLAYQRVVAGTNTDANDSIVFSCVYSF